MYLRPYAYTGAELPGWGIKGLKDRAVYVYARTCMMVHARDMRKYHVINTCSLNFVYKN